MYIALFALALIPVIALLLIIFFLDKKEKEPIGLLTGLFFAGMGTIITAIIIEGIGEFLLNALFPFGAALKSLVLSIFIIGPAEELGKYAVLRLITWKNKNFDYSYDAIVYAVFVSLGFAALENVGYVFSNGIGTAFLRMFTAVPGHACFAVFMGFFYSKSKYASLTGKKQDQVKYTILSLVVPIIGHGLYDGIVLSGRDTNSSIITGLSMLLWIGYVIVIFAVACITIVWSSKHDFCIVTLPDAVQTVYKPSVAGTWKCMCGAENYSNFCSQCGKQRPLEDKWICPKCGTLSAFRFCGNCGCPRPAAQPISGNTP
ncbi:Membrane proteinase PrsW, cleaves anti-sigma factor RsiW, M82 family [Ruminococcaceae bacterium YRB3002]|nr:Membrane proteinase PrsW, cleaves anti-sigma factor RsiW, M82 family [Ruminococcaceae bacterium YRB3002]